MKFIIDEQLPIKLADWLNTKGFDTLHTSYFNKKSLNDKEIRAISMGENRILISKDEDFFNSFILLREPYKLIFLTTGNIKNRQLLDIFRENFNHILKLIEQHDVLEVKKDLIKIWF